MSDSYNSLHVLNNYALISNRYALSNIVTLCWQKNFLTKAPINDEF